LKSASACVTLMADADGGDASHPPNGAVVVVGSGASDALELDDDEGDALAAAGFFESLLHAAIGTSASTQAANATQRRLMAIGAVFHPR
jgi:hypothetical protein